MPRRYETVRQDAVNVIAPLACGESWQCLNQRNNQVDASLVVKEGGDCPANSEGWLKDVLLQRINECMESVQLYAPAEDVKQGSPQLSAVYTKVDCRPSQVD